LSTGPALISTGGKQRLAVKFRKKWLYHKESRGEERNHWEKTPEGDERVEKNVTSRGSENKEKRQKPMYGNLPGLKGE